MHVTLRTAAAVALTLALQSALAATDEGPVVVVTATRQATRASEVLADVTVIGAQEIRNAGPTTTVGELLGRQPGIEFKQSGGSGTSNVFIRGSNANHVLLLVDGIRTGSVTSGTPTWEYIPLEQIDRIEIVRGPASSLYGSDAIGGVVQIFTKRGDGPVQPFVEAGYGTYNTKALSAGVSGGQQGWRYSLQVSDKRSDSFSAIDNPKNAAYNPDKDGNRATSSSGNFSYSPIKGHEFGMTYLYSDGWNRYDMGSASSTPPGDDYQQKETIYSANLYSRNRLTDIWTSTLRIGRSSDDSRQLDNGRLSSSFRSTQTQYQWQNDIRLPLGIALLGLERVDQEVASNTSYALKKRSIDSVFGGWTAYLNNHSLQLNIREDRNSQFGSKTTGMAGYGYQFAAHWRGSLSWGTAFKAPTFNDLYYPPDAYGNVSNPNLQPETSDNREAALHYETAAQHASLTYYHNDVKNLIQWAPIDPTFVRSGYTPSNVASATLSGWTLAYNGVLGNYELFGSVDLQDPKDNSLQKTLVYRARETAKLGLTRDLGGLDIGGEIQASGKRYVNTANTQQLSGYGLVNLIANYRVTKDWSAFARANNIFDKKYALTRDYATAGANIFVGVRYAPK